MRFFGIGAALCVIATTAFSEVVMTVDVDGSDLPRRLLHSRIEMPVEPGEQALWFPKWIPGIHYYGGPVHNMTGLRITTVDGKALTWRRDEEEYWRFWVTVPDGVTRIVVGLDYITNQPTTQSTGIDSYGFPHLGVVNFNTALLYPDGYSNEEIRVRLRFRTPEGWEAATSLSKIGVENDWIAYDETTLEEVVDSPLLCGAYFKTLTLTAKNGPVAYLHMAGSAPAAVDVGEDVTEEMTRLMNEAYALFGGAPFDEYHFLLALSDDIPGIGLEHLKSSLNAQDERDMVDAKKRQDGIAYLLPHELTHAWCGKWRRPEGMVVRNYHEPLHTKGLWIYEGLDQYLGEVLMVRAGMLEKEKYQERFALKILGLQSQAGRRWRPLADTAVFAGPLRGASPNWNGWRRGQDYYNEGLLIWLEADAYIREATRGRKSLDDFCEQFFAYEEGAGPMKAFTLDEVCAVLNGLVERDWAAYFHARVEETQEALPTNFVKTLGYRLDYVEKAPAYRKESDGDRKRIDLRDSLGLVVADSGVIQDIVPESISDAAGLAPGMTIAGVDDWKFSADRLNDALAGSREAGGISLLVLHGDQFRRIDVPYGSGARYLSLVREDGVPDRFGAILESRTR